MELCTFQAISKIPSHKILFQNPSPTTIHCSNSSLLSLRRPSPISVSPIALARSRYSRNFVSRATASEDTSSGASQYGSEERDTVATLENFSKSTKEEPTVYGKTLEPEVTKEELPAYGGSTKVTEGEPDIFEFFEKFNIDTIDKYSLALYGSGALFTLWLSSAVVGAIDKIPLFPKLMELIGLGYTSWFSYRYLLFKNTRVELFGKFEELKEEVIGSDDD